MRIGSHRIGIVGPLRRSGISRPAFSRGVERRGPADPQFVDDGDGIDLRATRTDPSQIARESEGIEHDGSERKEASRAAPRWWKPSTWDGPIRLLVGYLGFLLGLSIVGSVVVRILAT